jgi:Mg-chelatase subunit ChlD
LQAKDYCTSIIILADVSGSMGNGNRIGKMREGVMRIAELAERFGQVKTELVLIEFDDAPRVLFDGSQDIKKVCAELRPKGGTNIGAALGKALTIASTRISLGNAVHIALFTDGEDPAFKIPSQDLISLHRLCVHCIGICREADARVLNTVAKAARRGTFQQSEDISALMGTLWGLMMEVVDENIRLRWCFYVKLVLDELH